MDNRPLVMAVEADVDALSRLYRLLSEAGYRTATYSSAPAACRYAEEEAPDLILAPMDFVGHAPLDLVRELRAASPSSRILVMAAFESVPSLEEVDRAGADILVSRGAGDEELKTAVQEALREPRPRAARPARPGTRAPVSGGV